MGVIDGEWDFFLSSFWYLHIHLAGCDDDDVVAGCGVGEKHKSGTMMMAEIALKAPYSAKPQPIP